MYFLAWYFSWDEQLNGGYTWFIRCIGYIFEFEHFIVSGLWKATRSNSERGDAPDKWAGLNKPLQQ
jgi:hypothetical protein